MTVRVCVCVMLAPDLRVAFGAEGVDVVFSPTAVAILASVSRVIICYIALGMLVMLRSVRIKRFEMGRYWVVALIVRR